jgi:hypothetical protein
MSQITPVVCEWCGTEFRPRQRTKANRFCSAACYHVGRKQPIADRFIAFVDVRGTDDCWEWQGYRNPAGYGDFSDGKGVHYGAHRFAYILAFGGIPDGMVVRHKCDNPPCVNPLHLIAGNPIDNVRDKIERGRFRTVAPKLSDDAVRDVRRRWDAGGITQTDLAREYGVSKSLIRLIVLRKHRAHVSDS